GEALAPSADWFSFGVMLFEAITGKRPFDDPFHASLGCRGVGGPTNVRAHVPEAPADLVELISALLDPVARRRPDHDHVVAVLNGARPAAKAPSQPPQAPTRSTPPCAPRGAKHAAFAKAFDRVQRGHPALVRLHGGSGSGKTALVARFLCEAEQVG